MPDEDRAPWAAAFYAGLRRGELRALRDVDVDLAANVIHVRRSWDDVAGEIAPKCEKGARDVPLPALLRRHLLEHRARMGRRGPDLFFGRTARAPFTPTHIRDRARAAWAATVVGAFFAGRSADIETIGLHECRHTYVSLMHAAGVPLERIGDYVGHSPSYMTDRYRHLIDGQRVEDTARFDSLLERNLCSVRGEGRSRLLEGPIGGAEGVKAVGSSTARRVGPVETRSSEATKSPVSPAAPGWLTGAPTGARASGGA